MYPEKGQLQRETLQTLVGVTRSTHAVLDVSGDLSRKWGKTLFLPSLQNTSGLSPTPQPKLSVRAVLRAHRRFYRRRCRTTGVRNTGGLQLPSGLTHPSPLWRSRAQAEAWGPAWQPRGYLHKHSAAGSMHTKKHTGLSPRARRPHGHQLTGPQPMSHRASWLRGSSAVPWSGALSQGYLFPPRIPPSSVPEGRHLNSPHKCPSSTSLPTAPPSLPAPRGPRPRTLLSPARDCSDPAVTFPCFKPLLRSCTQAGVHGHV